jgi:predicted AlkP superfamily phosphohydrolase/phosphomutase
MREKVVPLILLFSLTIALTGAGCARVEKHKVFVLGIDGITFDLLLPWAQEGKLPHFASLLNEGSSTQLISTIPPISPPAWTSSVTGVNPGKHGMFGFVKEAKPGADGRRQLTFYTSRDREADPLWVLLSEQGRRSVVINVPSSSPPDKLRGVMIAGFPHTSPTHFTYPPEYRLRIPGYRIDAYGREVSEGEEQAFLEDLMDIADRRAQVAFKLLEEEPWELFFVVFTVTDWIQHYYWKFMDPGHPHWNPEKARLHGDAILKTYQRMDRFLGQLRSKLDSRTSLVVMSDHGFGPVYRLVNGQNFIDQLRLPDDLDVTATENFGVALDLAVPQGISSDPKTHPSHGRAMELLRKELHELRDPASGQKVIRQVFDREELYWGPYVDRSPTLVGLEREGFLFFNWHPTQDKELFLQREAPISKRAFSGYHAMNGVLIMAGANVRRGVNNFEAQIADIAPTVLYLMEATVPEDMDGGVLTAPISEKYLSSHPPDARQARSSRPRQSIGHSDSTRSVDEYIEAQLRAIGYVQ